MGIALEDEPSLSTCLPRRESLSDQKTWQRTRPIHPVSSLHALIRSVLSHLCPCASFQRLGMTFWLFTASPLSVVTLRHLHPLQPFLWTLQSALSGRGFSSRLTWIKNFHRHFCQTRTWSFSVLKAFLWSDVSLLAWLGTLVVIHSSQAASMSWVWFASWKFKGLHPGVAIPELETSTVDRGVISVSWSLFSWHSFMGPCQICFPSDNHLLSNNIIFLVFQKITFLNII